MNKKTREKLNKLKVGDTLQTKNYIIKVVEGFNLCEGCYIKDLSSNSIAVTPSKCNKILCEAHKTEDSKDHIFQIIATK